MTAFKIFLSNLLCRYTVKSSTKRISKHRFNQLNLTKNYQLLCPLTTWWDLCIGYS